MKTIKTKITLILITVLIFISFVSASYLFFGSQVHTSLQMTFNREDYEELVRSKKESLNEKVKDKEYNLTEKDVTSDDFDFNDLGDSNDLNTIYTMTFELKTSESGVISVSNILDTEVKYNFSFSKLYLNTSNEYQKYALVFSLVSGTSKDGKSQMAFYPEFIPSGLIDIKNINVSVGDMTGDLGKEYLIYN